MSTRYSVSIKAETIDTELVEIYMSGEQAELRDRSTGELLAELMARNCGSSSVSVGDDMGRESSYARFELEF